MEHKSTMGNLIRTVNKIPKNKKLIVFDLDGTLTESKSDMDEEMVLLFRQLLKVKKVAVISGGKYALFQRQFLAKLRTPKKLLENLFLFPTTATTFYRYDRGWRKVYEEKLSFAERLAVKEAFKKAFRELRYRKPKKTYGRVIEDRGTQITFSALGQNVVKSLGAEGVRLKKEWRDKNAGFKLKLARTLQKLLPGLEVQAAGYTSVDVTRKGIDKEYGLKQIKKYLDIPFSRMLFVGDALFPGGNDSAALRTGVLCVEVKTVDETKNIIRHLLAD